MIEIGVVEAIIGLVVIVLGPYGGVRAGLNGMKKDVKDIKEVQTTHGALLADARERLARIEGQHTPFKGVR